jgi:hypothetical protein
MQAQVMALEPLSALYGTYGDLFWDLPSVVTYIAGQQMPCVIYVANITDGDLSYMLRARTYDTKGNLLSEGVVTTNERTWFDVKAHEYVALSGAILSPQSNVNLVLELVESVTQEVTDAVSAWLHTPTTAELPGIASGGVTSSVDVMSSILPLLMMGLMVGLVLMGSRGGRSEKKGA